VAVRRALAPYLREAAPAYGALAILVLLLLVWAPTQALRQPVTALVLVGLIAAGFEVLRRQTAREFPDAERRLGLNLRAALGRLTDSNGGHRSQVAGDGEAPTVATAPGAAAGPAATDPIERLERVAALHERGALTDDEFTAEKDAILAAR
jgi:Short C-terminal domain